MLRYLERRGRRRGICDRENGRGGQTKKREQWEKRCLLFYEKEEEEAANEGSEKR